MKPKKSEQQLTQEAKKKYALLNENSFTYNVHVKKSEHLGKLKEFFIKNFIGNPKFFEKFYGFSYYFCRYEQKNKKGKMEYFMKIGFLNLPKEGKEMFYKNMQKCPFVTKIVLQEMHPFESGEADIDLSKFLAARVYGIIYNWFNTEFNDYYNYVSEHRKRDMFLIKRNPKEQPLITALDYAHMMHHVFNMLGDDYDKEILLHQLSAVILQYNLNRGGRI